MKINLERDCEMFILSEEQNMTDFDCGDEDLNDFFNREALLYKRQMLAETYFFRLKCSGTIVCAFSISASSIKTADLPANRSRKVKDLIPREKTLKAYPGILVGRLGVATEFNGQGTGSQLMDFIKDFCLVSLPSFVRYLLVDAYNKPEIIRFYQKNYFITVYSTEEQEKSSYRQAPAGSLRTRYMFYDMTNWRDKTMP
ncbi:MAG: GNAT family N-acetyltransferase [Treponema sp.]|nr:GNAT family N-acetyltransferase [Treponema sp.]